MNGHDDYDDTVANRGAIASIRPDLESAADIIRANDVVTGSFPRIPKLCTVRLDTSGRTVTWSSYQPREKFVIGRSDSCNLVIKSDAVSRVHGYLTVIDKGCIYFDQSRNGSSILINGALKRLSKAGTVLSGRGILFIGSDPTQGPVDDALVVKFDISMK